MFSCQETALRLADKMKDLQQRIDAVVARLSFLQKTYSHINLKTDSMNENPLEKYLMDKSEVHSIPTIKSKQEPRSKKTHNRHHSQQIGQSNGSIKKFQNQQKSLDSKSFGMIKQSILLNSQEIDHLKEKMIDLEKSFIEKIMGIEQGVGILTRLTHVISNRIDQNHIEGKPILKERTQKTDPLQDEIRINRVIKKYQQNRKISIDQTIKTGSKFFF